MNKVLITGGAGFIGSNLTLQLISKGYEVTVLDNLSPQIHGESPETTSPLYLSIRDKVTSFVKGDVCNSEVLAATLASQDAVIHLAAETGTGQSMYQVERYTRINIGGTAKLLDLLTNVQHTVKKVIIASSRAIYGEGRYESPELGFVYPEARTARNMKNGLFEPIYPGSSALKLIATDEYSRIAPTSIYGITKQAQEQMVMVSCKAIGIAATALRYQNVYGPGQSLSNPYTGILSIFSTLIKNGKPINIFEDGKESRDFVYINDVVNATILALEKSEADGETFNVGSGTPTTVLEVAQELISNYGVAVPLNISGNFRLGDIRHNFADLTKIKTKLGFRPTVDFKLGMKMFADWVNTQVLPKSQYDKSIQELESKGLFLKS